MTTVNIGIQLKSTLHECIKVADTLLITIDSIKDGHGICGVIKNSDHHNFGSPALD